MDNVNILTVNREHLLIMQVLCWLGPGVKVLVTGLKSMLLVSTTNPERVWWLSLIAVTVAILFSLMFSVFVKRYTARILAFEERKKSIFAFMSVKGYIMITFFMCLGIGLKFVPGMPIEFFAAFYPGLGAALSIAGLRFLNNWTHSI